MLATASVTAPQPPRLMRLAAWGGGPSATRLSLALFCSVFLVGLVARLYGIGNMPFWLDEVTTVQRSSLPFWSMVQNALAAHHLPSYFVITSLVGRYGLSESVLRVPSAIFGGASCAIVYLIGERLGGWRAGLVAGLLLALSPLHVQYGQEARSYTFVIFMMAIGFLGLVELARDPRAASLPRRDPGVRLAPWAIYMLGTAGALQVLSIAFFWLISANCAAIAVLMDKTIDRRRFLLRWLGAQAVVLLLTLPWFGAMAVVTKGHMANATDWVPPISAHSFLSTLGSLYLMRVSRLISFHLFPEVIPGFGVFLLVFGLMGLAYLRPRRTDTRIPTDIVNARAQSWTLFSTLAIAAVVPPLTILAISFFKPLWMPRYLIWSSVPFFVFVGLGVDFLPWSRWRNTATALLAVLALVNLVPYYHAETKPRWDLAALDLQLVMQPGDLILVPDRGPVAMMNFFLGREDQVIPDSAWTKDVFVAAEHLQDGGRVWAVSGKVGQADHTPTPSFEKVISPLGHPVETLEDGALITLTLYAMPPSRKLVADGSY
jgi:mannosyltransferase